MVDVGGESTRPGAASGRRRRGAAPGRARRRGARRRGAGVGRHGQGVGRSRRARRRGDLVERRLVEPGGGCGRARRRLGGDALQGDSRGHAATTPATTTWSGRSVHSSSVRRRRSGRRRRRRSRSIPGSGSASRSGTTFSSWRRSPSSWQPGSPCWSGPAARASSAISAPAGRPTGGSATSRRSGPMTGWRARSPRPCGRWRAGRRWCGSMTWRPPCRRLGCS